MMVSISLARDQGRALTSLSGAGKRRESPERPDLQLVALAKDTLGSIADAVYGIVTSRWLHMAILRVFLTLSFTTFAYYFAVPAYAYFYHVHLPDQVITAPLHLQYGWQIGEEGEYKNTHPYAIAPLTHGTIKTLQPYDVDITLTLPRSPGNLDHGNFMVGLLLLGDPDPVPTNTTTPRFPQTPSALISPIDPIAYRTSRPTLHASLRPTGLPYRSPLVTLAAALLRLPYYALYPDAELATLTVVMAERLTFPRGAPVPRVALVEIQTAGRPYLEVYSAEVTLRSKLGGLRWLMYHYRVTSFVVFTIMFTVIAVWCFLVTFTVGGLVVKALMPAAEAGRKRGGGDWEDEDEEDMSDTERTFPSRTGGAVVKFEGKGVQIKVEEEEEEQDPGMEAGDEEEEEGVVVGGIMGERDSGIGTSYDDDTGREGARRRVSGKGKEKVDA